MASLPLSKYAVTSAAPRPTRLARKTEAAAERNRELRMKDKIDQANRILDKIEERQAKLGEAIKELQKARSLLAVRAERISDRVLQEMLDAGLTRAAGVHTCFSLRPAPESVDVIDERSIPAAFLRTREVSAPDKVAIKAAIAKGENVPGVRLTQKVCLIRK